MQKRIDYLDYIKAFACFLVVIGHLIQSLHTKQLDPIYEFNSFVNWFIYLFHMPVFISVSGYLYFSKKKNISLSEYKDFSLKKIINLMIPYFIFYIIYMLLNTIFSSSVNEAKGIEGWIGIINNPISPYWFLYSLTSLFIIIPILEKIFKYKYNFVFVFLVILKLVSYVFSTKLYIIDSIMQYGIFFYLGYYLNSMDKKIQPKTMVLVLLVFIYIFIASVVYLLSDNLNYYFIKIIKLLLSTCATFIVFNLFKKIQESIILDTIKQYTFQIYLTHTIFAAGIRILLFKIGIQNYWLHFIAGLIFSVYIPIIMAKISEKIKYTEFVFFPIQTIKKLKEGK